MRHDSMQKNEPKAMRSAETRTLASIDEDEKTETSYGTWQSLTEHLDVFEYRLPML